MGLKLPQKVLNNFLLYSQNPLAMNFERYEMCLDI